MKHGSADLSALMSKAVSSTAAIGYSVKAAPIRFFFDGDKAPHFRCPPGTRRSGKWTDRLGTDCELGGARVALARIGERMQNIARGEGGKRGKNPALPTVGERLEFRLSRAAHAVDGGAGSTAVRGKKKRRGVATMLGDAAHAIDGGAGSKKKRRGLATALGDAAHAIDGGAGSEKKKRRGVATMLGDAAHAVDGGAGSSAPKKIRSAEGKLPSPKKDVVGAPKKGRKPGETARAITAIEDATAAHSVRPKRKRIKAVTKYPTDIAAAAKEDLAKKHPDPFTTPEEINAVLTGIHKSRAIKVKRRDHLDGLIARDRLDPAHSDARSMHREARRLDHEIAIADRQIEDLHDQRAELKKKVPEVAAEPVKRPVKKVVKKAPAKKAVAKKAAPVKKAAPAKKAVARRRPAKKAAAPRIVVESVPSVKDNGDDPMFRDVHGEALKNVTKIEFARDFDKRAGENLLANHDELMDAVRNGSESPSALEAMANAYARLARERVAVEDHLGRMEREKQIADKIERFKRRSPSAGSQNMRDLRDVHERLLQSDIEERDRHLKKARELEAAAWGSKTPQRGNDGAYPKIAPDEKVEDFVRRIEAERLAIQYHDQARTRADAIAKIDDAIAAGPNKNPLSPPSDPPSLKPASPVKKVAKKAPAKKAVKKAVKRPAAPVSSSSDLPPAARVRTPGEIQQVVDAVKPIAKVKLAKKREPQFGFAGDVGPDGIARVEAVRMGGNGIMNVEQARKYLAEGGNIADVPDAFLHDALIAGGGGGRRGGAINVPAGLQGKFVAHRPAQGIIGDNQLVLVPGRKDRGFFFKAASDEENANELIGHQVAHAVGIPILPGRWDGKNDAGQRFVMVEHGFNMVDAPNGPQGHFDADVANLDKAHGLGMEARIPHFLVNYLMAVPDRHSGNGLLGQDADGNWVAIPIDLGWAGRHGHGVAGLTEYGFGMDTKMTRAGAVGRLIRDTYSPEEAAALKAHLRVVVKGFHDRMGEVVANRSAAVEDLAHRAQEAGAPADEVRRIRAQAKRTYDTIAARYQHNSLADLYRHFGI